MQRFVLVFMVLASVMVGIGCHGKTKTDLAPLPDEARGDEFPEWPKEYHMLVLQLGGVPLDYHMTARAGSREAADALFEPLLRDRTRAPIPPGVEVEYFTSVELSGGRVCIHNSTSRELDVFRVALGGETLADLSSGKNVEMTRPGGGWITYTACLPLERVPAGTRITLTSHPRGKPEDSTFQRSIEF